MQLDFISNKIKDKQEILLYLFLLITIILAIAIRLKGLGKWPLAVDEYYLVKSSENILKHGLPQWDAGGYYMRGLPQQYLTAFLLMLGLKAEFASRIIPLIANVLALPALYLLGKKLSGKTLAAALVFIFSFSVWEVEFARFARMYTAFQSIFVWYIYFLYRYIFEDDSRSLKYLFTLSFAGIFIYEASIFLVLMNFIPLFWDRKQQTLNLFSKNNYMTNGIHLITSVIILVFAYWFLTFNFRTFNQHDLLPPDVIDYYKTLNSGGKFRIPDLLLSTVLDNGYWIILTAALLVFNIFSFVKLYGTTKPISKLAACGILLFLSFLNLLGLLLLFTLIFLMIGWIELKDFKIFSTKDGNNRFNFRSTILVFMLPAFLINFLFWCAFALRTESWHKFFLNQTDWNAFSSLKLIIKNSLNYPYLYESYVLFRDTIPFATAAYLLLIAILFIYVLKNFYKEETKKLKLFLFLLMILILAQNILKLTYFDTRYFFFIYPLIMLLAVLSVEAISGYIKKKLYSQVVFISIWVFILAISEDFDFNHLANIDSKEQNFRINFSFPLTVHYYPRWDVKTPSEIVNKEAAPDDIVITNEHSVDYYLKRLNYIFKDYKGLDFKGESILNGTKERWTNANLVYRYSDLNNMIDTSKTTVWLLINNMWALDDLNAMIKKYNRYLYYTSVEGRILLYKINSYQASL